MAPLGEEQGVLAGPAAGIEDRPVTRSATSTNAGCGLPMSQGGFLA